MEKILDSSDWECAVYKGASGNWQYCVLFARFLSDRFHCPLRSTAQCPVPPRCPQLPYHSAVISQRIQVPNRSCYLKMHHTNRWTCTSMIQYSTNVQHSTGICQRVSNLGCHGGAGNVLVLERHSLLPVLSVAKPSIYLSGSCISSVNILILFPECLFLKSQKSSSSAQDQQACVQLLSSSKLHTNSTKRILGLACALSLHKQGCQGITVVDAAEHGENSSRAIVVHAATLEVCTEGRVVIFTSMF